MNCPECHNELHITKHKGVYIHQCASCQGFWFEGDEFKEAMEKEDEFLRWVDLDLWKEDEKHTLEHCAESCPECQEYLYEVSYKGYDDIHPKVCVDCRGVWIEEDQLIRIILYLESQLDAQTLKDFLKHLGQEAIEIFSHESLSVQFKDSKMVLKLIGYRLFSRFQFLDRLSRNLPKP